MFSRDPLLSNALLHGSYPLCAGGEVGRCSSLLRDSVIFPRTNRHWGALGAGGEWIHGEMHGLHAWIETWHY